MELHTHINQILYKAALLSIALFVVSVGLNVWQFLIPKGNTGNCNSFGSYADVLESFHNGNRGLDGDGDGIPCENRK